ncbi:HEL214Wp [Eremothecium sinecaudum]|uniref:DNA-directed RNA polymerase subunit n=1 Tax=Eremothecium sinecaudum TaxID=45286 RepID=A0A0X8HT71_9SACH|nr:HEL214Wp [Eremothecium sinecaudum]AMD21067.1 HEL214Wp [Eremothecium sinecaudum]
MVEKRKSPGQLKALKLIKKHKKQFKNPIDETHKTSQCICRIPVTMYVSMVPIYQQNPLEGIRRQHLNPMLMKYNSDVGGVVLGYENISLVDENPFGDETKDAEDIKLVKLTADTPFGFSWCKVDLIVWAPQVGDIVEGWIFIQSASHIGLLIHDAFNASIKKNNIPSDWTFIHSEESATAVNDSSDTANFKKHRSLGHWVDSNGEGLGGKLKFVIKHVYTTGRMVSLDGTLIGDDNVTKSQAENLPVVSNTKIIFDDEVSQENKESHKDLKLSVVTEDNGAEIVYEKDSSDSDSDASS